MANYRKAFKAKNPMLDKINKGLPIEIHHKEQQCDGGSDDIENLQPMLRGRHQKHNHHKKGLSRELDFEDYLFEV